MLLQRIRESGHPLLDHVELSAHDLPRALDAVEYHRGLVGARVHADRCSVDQADIPLELCALLHTSCERACSHAGALAERHHAALERSRHLPGDPLDLLSLVAETAQLRLRRVDARQPPPAERSSDATHSHCRARRWAGQHRQVTPDPGDLAAHAGDRLANVLEALRGIVAR